MLTIRLGFGAQVVTERSIVVGAVDYRQPKSMIAPMDSRNLLNKPAPRKTVTVPKSIIDTAIQNDSSHCMIAEAIKEAIPEAKFVAVDLATIRFTIPEKGVRYVYLTPRSAQAALLKFDAGEPVKSFRVRLEGGQTLLAGSAHRSDKAKLVKDPRSRPGKNQVPPRRVGGQNPPRGALSNLPTKKSKAAVRKAKKTAKANQVRTGRRREYGLRAIVRD